MPDVTASAFFKGCDIYHTLDLNAEFAASLKPRAASIDFQAKYDFESYVTFAGYGVKLLPSFKGAKLLPEQQEIFRFYGYPKQWWDPTPFNPSPFRLATKSPTVALDVPDETPDT